MTGKLSDAELLDFLEGKLAIEDWGRVRLWPLPVNYTSCFWRLDAPNRSYVIKEFFPGNETNPLYQTLPDQEADALLVLARYNLSPDLELFVQSPSGAPLLVYGYSPPISNEIAVEEAAQLIGRFAALTDPLPGHQTVPAGAEEVLERGDAMLAKIPESRKAANLKRLRPATRKARAAWNKRSLVHRSFCLGTIQATGEGARLIDWQYAGLGDPVEDVVCFVSPGLARLYGHHPLVAHAEELFLKHYPDRDTVERFFEDRGAYHWRLAAYCLYRQETLSHSNAPAARAYGKALEEEVDLMLRLKGR